MKASEIPLKAAEFQALAKTIPPVCYEKWENRLSVVTTTGLEISRPRQPDRSRHNLVTVVAGEPDKVLEHISWMFSQDSCTPMYEHMLLRVGTVEFESEDRIRVVLVKNNYAGD